MCFSAEERLTAEIRFKRRAAVFSAAALSSYFDVLLGGRLQLGVILREVAALLCGPSLRPRGRTPVLHSCLRWGRTDLQSHRGPAQSCRRQGVILSEVAASLSTARLGPARPRSRRISHIMFTRGIKATRIVKRLSLQADRICFSLALIVLFASLHDPKPSLCIAESAVEFAIKAPAKQLRSSCPAARSCSGCA
jgi:hypothetical protein